MSWSEVWSEEVNLTSLFDLWTDAVPDGGAHVTATPEHDVPLFLPQQLLEEWMCGHLSLLPCSIYLPVCPLCLSRSTTRPMWSPVLKSLSPLLLWYTVCLPCCLCLHDSVSNYRFFITSALCSILLPVVDGHFWFFVLSVWSVFIGRVTWGLLCTLLHCCTWATFSFVVDASCNGTGTIASCG